MAAWSLVPILALATAGLSIESLSPDSLCPPQQETQAAVAARLGRVEIEGPWRATYVLVHRTRGDFVTLRLFDPSGALRLKRDLPVQSGSCASLAEVMALVLERFFLRSDELADSTLSAPAASPTPPAPAPPAQVSASQSAATSSAPATRALEPISGPAEVAAASSTVTERSTWVSAELWANTAWLAPSLSLARDVGDAYRVGVSGGFDLVQHRASVYEGSATLRRIPLWLSGSALWRIGSTLRARSSVELMAVLEQAQTRALAESGSGTRVVPGLGARLGAEWFLQSRAQPFIELTAAWLIAPLSPAFEVGARQVLAPPALALGLSVGIQTPF